MVAKSRLDEQTMALRAAKELQDGFYVNLGIGVGSLVSSVIPPDRTVIFQAENGILGVGPLILEEEKQDLDLINAAVRPTSIVPGASFFDIAESFAMIRGRHLDRTILGAFQVSERGDLANWLVPGGEKAGGIGGAMDLALGAKEVIVVMEHTTRDGKPRILKECTYPLTAKECVNLIITDIAVIRVTKKGLLLKELAPGWTVDDVQALTEPTLKIAEDLKEMEL